MDKLEEKAKTFQELKAWYYQNYALNKRHRFLTLEVARQEIDSLNSHYEKLKKDRDNLWKIVQSLTTELLK